MLKLFLFILPCLLHAVSVSGKYLLDEEGRQLLLRGVNLSGAAKLPDPFTKSFIDRPIKLQEADEHFERIRNLGMNHIRFLVTWEAIEGRGPGLYDEGYIRYVADICKIAGEHGLYVIIDMHQDLFSRHLFGSGAPKWALEAVGLNLDSLVESDALVDPLRLEKTHPEYLHLAWFFNYNRIACQTMFTLFFGGKTFTPSFKVGGVNIQDFLQTHYIQALCRLMEELKTNPYVLGCNTMNEPHPGFIGKDLEDRPENPLGPSPCYKESLAIGAGLSSEVEVFERKMTRLFKTGSTVLNPGKLSIFKNGCPFAKEGVYRVANGEIVGLNPYYFQFKTFPYRFQEDFYLPFVEKLQGELLKIDPRFLLFIEGIVGENFVKLPPNLRRNCVYSFHWYEGIAFYLKKYLSNLTYSHLEKKVHWGRASYIRDTMLEELKKFSDHPLPVVLSETGFSRDIPQKERRDCYERLFSILDALQLHTTFWHYAPQGDAWNFENFSIYKEEEENDFSPFLRPYPMRIPGILLFSHYEPKEKILTLEWEQDPENFAPMEIFFPLGYEPVFVGEPTPFKREKGVLYLYSRFSAKGNSRLRNLQLRVAKS
jgi:hypothetical protein